MSEQTADAVRPIIIRPREREAILQSLRAGVVPSVGLQHIQVGRKREVMAILDDLEKIEQGASAIRFVIGRYGSGKSFFLHLTRSVALERKFVVLQADITTERRLHSTGGHARALYAELMRSAAIRTRPDGNALSNVVERWVAQVQDELDRSGRPAKLEDEIHARLRPLEEFVSGYDFARVVTRYVRGYRADDREQMDGALRWMRAEFTTKTEANQAVGVHNIIDDRGFYDYLKLFASFVRLAGYAGLLVNLDEMGVLSHRLNHALARNANYEALLHILNDCTQGNVCGIGFLFSGTAEFLEDRRRGLYSYPALATRLAPNQFTATGLADFSGPVLRLTSLSPEEVAVLLMNIRHVFAGGDPDRYLVPNEAITAFVAHCANRLGAEYYSTPRDIAKPFVEFLSVLSQNPEVTWQSLLPEVTVERLPQDDGVTPGSEGTGAVASVTGSGDEDDDLATFTLTRVGSADGSPAPL